MARPGNIGEHVAEGVTMPLQLYDRVALRGPSPSTRFEPVMWRRWSPLSTTLHPVPEDACWNYSTRLLKDRKSVV